MLRFQSTDFSNFGSFEGEHNFNFADKGLHLITAQNLDLEGDSALSGKYSVGSGKSTLTMIPYFALYGNITKKMNKDRIINKRVGKDLKAALNFSVNNNQYRVERYRKHKQGKNGLFLYEAVGGNWHDITRSDIASTQQAINEIVLINDETFLKTVLLSREDLKQFLDYTPTERWRIFETIIQLDKLKKYQDIILKKKKQYQQDLAVISADLVSAANLVNHIQKEIQAFENNKTTKVTNLTNEIDELKKKMVLFGNIDVDSFVKNIKTAKDITENIEEIEDKIIDLKLAISSANQRIIKIDKLNITHTEDIAETQDQLDGLEPIKCHNCGVIQDEETHNKHKSKLQQHIDTLNKHIVDNNAVRSGAHKIWAEATEKLLEYEKKLKELKLQLEEIDIPEEYKENANDDLLTEIKNINENILIKETQLAQINKDDTHLKRMTVDLKAKTKELNKLSDEKIKLTTIVNELDYLDDILNIKNENSIKQYAVSTIMPVFNELVRQNLDQVFDDQLTLILDLLFNETIIFNGEQYDYHELSTGEKVKVNLSLNFAIFDAMRLNVMNSGIIILDEVYTNIDLPSINAFAEMIKTKYAQESAVYNITHQPEVIEALQPETITTIIKENGSSRLEVK
jgi:DNA repair exonuclease SbcCD ATPase subunit